MKQTVIEILEDLHASSSGHCGMRMSDLMQEVTIEFADLKTTVNQLYKDKKITVHDHTQGKLIKLKIN